MLETQSPSKPVCQFQSLEARNGKGRIAAEERSSVRPPAARKTDCGRDTVEGDGPLGRGDEPQPGEGKE